MLNFCLENLKKLRALARDFFPPPSKIPNELTLTAAYSADEEHRAFNLFMRNWGFKIVSEGPFSGRDLRLFLPDEDGPFSYGLLPEGEGRVIISIRRPVEVRDRFRLSSLHAGYHNSLMVTVKLTRPPNFPEDSPFTVTDFSFHVQSKEQAPEGAAIN